MTSLMNYHLCQYLPDVSLDMSYCCLLNGSGCTFYNNPCFPTQPTRPFETKQLLCENFSSTLAIAESLWDKILRLQDRYNANATEQQLYLMMEFIPSH